MLLLLTFSPYCPLPGLHDLNKVNVKVCRKAEGGVI